MELSKKERLEKDSFFTYGEDKKVLTVGELLEMVDKNKDAVKKCK